MINSISHAELSHTFICINSKPCFCFGKSVLLRTIRPFEMQILAAITKLLANVFGYSRAFRQLRPLALLLWLIAFYVDKGKSADAMKIISGTKCYLRCLFVILSLKCR